MNDALRALDETIKLRKTRRQEGSYTCYLFEKGTDKILKKCAEECGEVIIAAKNGDKEELVNEASDLLYHLLVLMADRDVPLADVEAELLRRAEKTGNLKQMKTVDKDS